MKKLKKTWFFMNLKNSNYDETQKLWWNLNTRIVIKLKNSNWDETQKLKNWQNLKKKNVTKLENSNGDRTEKLKWWQNSKLKWWQNWKTQNCFKKNQTVLKFILWQTPSVTKFKLLQNSKIQNLTTHIVTKLNKSNCDKIKKSKIVTKLKKIRLALEPPKGQYPPGYPQGFSTYYHYFVIPH